MRMSSPRWPLRKIVPPVLLVLAAVTMGGVLGIDGIKRLASEIDFNSPIGMLGVAALATVLMSTCVPKTAMSLTMGSLYSMPVACVMVLSVATTAAAINYGIGRWWMGTWQIENHSGDDADKAAWLRAIVRWGHRAGFATHFLIRMSPVPTMVISYACGGVRARFGPFIAAAAVAAVTQWVWVWVAASTRAVVADRWAEPKTDPPTVPSPLGAAAGDWAIDAATLRWITLGISVAAAVTVSVLAAGVVRRESIQCER